MSDTKTILLCGVGGQGTITAAHLLARAALAAGYEVKVSEIHGMAQRGGAVSTVVRFGDEVFSMVCDEGAADAVVSFDAMEALRNLAFLARDGFLLASSETILPTAVACGRAALPPDMEGRLAAEGALLIGSRALAEQAGNAKCENTVLLGALESRLGFGRELWEEVIAAHVPPKTVEANLAAFRAGLDFAASR